jgi:hypothetical protein
MPQAAPFDIVGAPGYLNSPGETQPMLQEEQLALVVLHPNSSSWDRHTGTTFWSDSILLTVTSFLRVVAAILQAISLRKAAGTAFSRNRLRAMLPFRTASIPSEAGPLVVLLDT